MTYYETEAAAKAALAADGFSPDGIITWKRPFGRRSSYQWATIERTDGGRYLVVTRNVFA